MKPAAQEVLRLVLDAMDTAGAVDLSTHDYRDLMRDIASEAQRRIRAEARTYRPRSKR